MAHIRKLCCLLLCVFGVFSCAPVPVVEDEASQDSSDLESTASDAEPDTMEQTGGVNPDAESPADENRSTDGEASQNQGFQPSGLGEQSAPDWKQRYQDLYDLFLPQFRRPPVGVNVTLKLASGRQVRGVISELTDTELFLQVEEGTVGFTRESLTPEAAQIFFASAFAHHRALEQGRKEYAQWQQNQTSRSERRPPPTPTPAQSAQPAPSAVRTQSSSPPVNEGPNGYVKQVEAYIRANAANPDSLRVKAWGPVQPHENGYKVRVQYSLQSTAGLGTSKEDMMFFMTSRGRVFRRAAVK